MRLWHEDLIGKLPRQQLLGQHRECCALRGYGWGKKHATVNYVFSYSPYKLFQFHLFIMQEMEKRGHKVDKLWKDPKYRGKTCERYTDLEEVERSFPIYEEHNEAYLQDCLENLREKGIVL